MQIALNNLREFVSRYVNACRGSNSPDLYLVITTETVPYGETDGEFGTKLDEHSKVAVANGQIVSNWTFLDELSATSVMYRHLEALSNDGQFRVGDPHDTFVELIARIRTALSDKFENVPEHEIDRILPDAYCGCITDGFDHKLIVSITDTDFESSNAVFTHGGGNG